MAATRTRSALLANLGSFGVLAVSGVLTNVLLSRFYGTGVLGSFNELLSLYFVGAQIATFGSHLAATRMMPLAEAQPQRLRTIALSALAIAACASAFVASVVFVGQSVLAAVFGQDLMDRGALPLCLALALCGVNKVLLGVFNGTERHYAFALVQALRPMAVLAGVLGLALAGLPGFAVPWLLALAEVGVSLVAGLLILPQFLSWPRGAHGQPAWPEVLRFSVRVLPGGLVAEANSRIDVLVLGALADDRVVGLYSFASTYAEGLAQLPSVIRNALNARLARMSSNANELWTVMPGLVRLGYLFLLPCFVAGTLAYVAIVHWSIADANRDTALWVFGIIVLCLSLAAGALPLDQLLAQLGYPIHLSLLRGATFTLNLIGCVVLYRLFGVQGVAASVGLTYLLYAAGTVVMARRLHPPVPTGAAQAS